MWSVLRGLTTALALAFLAPCAQATVLTFDDLTSPEGFGAMATSYQGFEFTNWYFINNPPFPYPHVSAPTIIYNAEIPYTTRPSISSRTPFNFVGVWMASYRERSQPVTLRGFVGANEVYTTTVTTVLSMSYFAFNFSGIDRLVMEVEEVGTLEERRFNFIDNLELVTAVPEPSALVLLGMGATLMAIRRRRSGR